MSLTITFENAESIPAEAGGDYVQFGFPFTVIETSLIGAPEERVNTQAHRLIVRIARTRLKGWRLNDYSLMKVLFEYARRHIEERVAADTLPDAETYTFRHPMVSSINTPDECPFDTDRIPNPEGFSMELERTRRIGF